MDTEVNNALSTIGEASKQIESGVLDKGWEFISIYGPKIVGAIIAFILMLSISKILASIVKRNIVKHSGGNNENSAKIANLMGDITFYVMVGFSIFVAFEIIGLNVGLLLGGISFGIGLAFKEVLGNMIAGIMILYTKQFRLGDVVEIQADKDYFGRIEEITIRYTIIRTLELKQVIIPNLKLISVPIKTFSAEELIRLDTIVGVHYDTDIEKAIQVIVNAINSFEFVKQKENTKVFVINFGSSSIDLKCLFLFDPNCGITGIYASGIINEGINNAFKANGIVIPYTHSTITFNSEEDKLKLLQKST